MTRFTSLESAKTSSHRILVVDDHGVNQQLAVMMIERLGHRADLAANGQEAVEAFSKIPYALVFMDCNMPVMDGYDATRAIRKAESEKLEGRSQMLELGTSDASHSSLFTPHCSHIPIIAMTANIMPEDREKCLQAGMDDYLPKPVRPEVIAQALEKWLTARMEKEEGRS